VKFSLPGTKLDSSTASTTNLKHWWWIFTLLKPQVCETLSRLITGFDKADFKKRAIKIKSVEQMMLREAIKRGT